MTEAQLDRRTKLLGHLTRSKEALLKKYVLRQSGASILQTSLVHNFESKEEIIGEGGQQIEGRKIEEEEEEK